MWACPVLAKYGFLVEWRIFTHVMLPMEIRARL